MARRRPCVAFFIQNEVQFFSLEPLIKRMIHDNEYDTVILVDECINVDGGFLEMAQETKKMIIKRGYKVKVLSDFAKDFVFDICLVPYTNANIKALCFLKYEYGTLNIKPKWTYTPDALDGIHGFLCESTVTADILSAYGMTFPVDNLRLAGRRRKQKKQDKTVVLFAPTYNEDCSDDELAKIIIDLKKENYVIIKGHHGTQYLNGNEGKKRILMELADEYYDSNVSLSELILSVDVCLFGNSSAIAEALYAGVPCAVYAHDLNFFNLDDMDTTQYKMVGDGILPYTDKIKEVREIVKEALTEKYKKKQMGYAKKVFPQRFKTGVDGYLKAIKFFLFDDNAKDYIKMYNYLMRYKKDLASNIEDMKVALMERDTEIAKRDAILEDFSKRKLYKVADKIYKIEGKFLHVKD